MADYSQYSADQLIQIVEEIDQLAPGVTDWEAEFIEWMLERRPTRLTHRQIDAIARMARAYLE